MNNFHAVDFGTGDALCVCGPDRRPRSGAGARRWLGIGRALVPRDEFLSILHALLRIGDVLTENSTIGSSGAAVDDIVEALSLHSNLLYTVQTKAVKNYLKDKGIVSYRDDRGRKDERSHTQDVLAMYDMVAECPARARVWRRREKIPRKHTSVRLPVQMDKLGYRDPHSVRLMRNLPPFGDLPSYIQKWPIGLDGHYRMMLAIPFAQAVEEPFVLSGAGSARDRFQRIIGMHGHGHPAHYRRMVVDWMQINAKGKNKASMEDVSPSERKEAWKVTQRQIRRMYRVCAEWMAGEYRPEEEVASAPLPIRKMRC